MNAKLAKMVEDMKKQTIGVEIEMAGITRQEAAKVVAKYFGTERTVRHEAGSYDSWSCQDRQGRVWIIHTGFQHPGRPRRREDRAGHSDPHL